MATKKGGGSSRNGRDSAGRRLGLKVGDGQCVSGGSILMRQRGTKLFAGLHVVMGSDHTLMAQYEGKVYFSHKKHRCFINICKQDKMVHKDPSVCFIK
jgi:large subunit ribosomal protein L27